VYLLYVVVPVVSVTGWMRGWRERPLWNVFTRATRIGFVLGTSSAMFALSSWVWSRQIPGFTYNAPELRKLYMYGILIALLAAIVSLVGVWRRSALRWHAVTLSLSMLVLWLVWASGE
jgi:hypothetical protein